jgi:hypothetical protein
MASTEGTRKSLRPLGQGPWRTDPAAVRFYGSISLVTCVVAMGLALVVPRYYTIISKPGDWVHTTVGIMLVLFVAALGSLAVMIVCWLGERTVQYCPECLTSMTRGAYVCPYCGFRETPRKEQP